LAGSVARTAHPVEHVTLPLGQVQAPATHVAPGLQALPHAPQWAGSVIVFAHTVPQRLGDAVGQLHAPAVHVAPTAQACPHEPQLLGSVCVFEHVVPHIIIGAAQGTSEGTSVVTTSVPVSVTMMSAGTSITGTSTDGTSAVT
jgi:hypothetical protein